MPVTNTREALGSWDINLHPETPNSITDRLDLDSYGFTHLVITPGHLQTFAVSDANLLALARYTGLYRTTNLSSRRQGEPVKIGGCHIAGLLGDEDGKGDTPTTGGTPTKAFWNGASSSLILDHVLNAANGITAGTIATHATTYDLLIDAGDSRRQILDAICSVASREWRINPNGTLDAGLKATLYPTTTTPTTVILADEGGQDGALTGIQADILNLDSDVEDFSSTVTVASSNGGYSGSATIGSNPYYGFTGSALTMRRVITGARAGSNTAAANIAATKLARFDETRRHVQIRADRYDIESDVKPGDGIYVYDPDQQLSSTTQVHYRGRIIFPVILRVESIRWPVQQGMGVYMRQWDPFNSRMSWTDLTPHVMWETGTADLDVGDVYRTLPAPRARLNA